MSGESPWTVLGLEPGSAPDAIRARYAALVKQHPPDRDADAFQRIRDAFEQLKDLRNAAEMRLFGPPPLDHLADLAAALAPLPRRPAGARAWIDALRELGR
ncbi:MAG: J domain-containing protein [Planctomycetes bacterium]|nr:J domain-containing protein [Planctomycetota bacterium]